MTTPTNGDRTPVLIGVGQINDHGTDAEPIELMAAAVEAAVADAGCGADLAARLDWIRVPWGVWPYADPARLVAERIGAPTARTTKTTVGGNQVYDLLIDSATQIGRGTADLIVVCGAETQRSRAAARRSGGLFQYLDEPEAATPDETFGSTAPLATAAEDAAGMNSPVVFYSMAESVIRHRAQETVAQHSDRIARLWEVGATVATDNPRAWLQQGPSSAEIRTPSPSNRPITAPYTKLLTSNLAVNQAGAFIVCSAETARGLGVSPDRWVFPHSGVSGADPQYVTNRWAFDESPSMRIAGARALSLAQVDIDDCALLDLYSCFPAAVEVAQREIGVPADRVWTITGGLTFAAGPLNCYCLLPMVRAVELLRAMPEQTAFLTGNGGYFTKHSFVTLSGRPPADGFYTESVQAEIDAEPIRATPTAPAPGDGIEDLTVEAYTVVYDREGEADRAQFALLDGDGSRWFASSTDSELMLDLITHDRVGVPAPADIAIARADRS